MIVYADTSALAKLLVDEPGSSQMRELVTQLTILASASIGYVELRAFSAAAIRAQRLPATQQDELARRVERLWSGVTEIVLDRPLLRDAGDLAEKAALRGYDAVHLAALRSMGPPSEVTFACWDAALRDAALQRRYALWPEN